MKDEYGHEMTKSHSELEIYKGCISLMHQLSGLYEDYMRDFLGFDPADYKDELPSFRFTPTEIVERLFLWNTSHSGGTSQHMKCKELGIDIDKTVTFGFPDGYMEDEE